MKEFLSALISTAVKNIGIITTVTVVTFTSLGLSLYLTQLDDGVYDDDEINKDKNVPYIVQDAIENIFSGEESVDELGEILTIESKSGQGWTYAYKDDDQIKPIDLDVIADRIITKSQKNNAVLETYIKDIETITKDGKTLQTSETLKLMIKAQLVTQYPDLRKKDYIRKAVGTDELQGCIKFIRNRYDKELTLQYIPLGKEDDDENKNTLYGKIKKANKKTVLQELADGYTGKDDVFNYFSLDTSGNLIIAEEERTDTKSAETTYMVEYAEKEVDEEKYKSYVKQDRTNSEIEATLWGPSWKYKIKTINYNTAVSRYTIPFEYLWAFLVCGRDEQFVRDFANYVLDSEIDIGIYDNIATEESEVIKAQANTNTWTRRKTITRVYEDGSLVSGPTDSGWLKPYGKPKLVPRYASVSRKMEYFDTIEISIINANIWSMKFDETREFIKPKHTNENLEKFVVEREDPDDPEKLWKPEELEKTNQSSKNEIRYKDEILYDAEGKQYSEQVPYTVVIKTVIETWRSISVWKNQKAITYADKEHGETQDRVEYYYQVGKTETTPKDNITASEKPYFYPNFCTLYNESGQEKYNLENSMQWFFEVLANNSSTVNLLPMTKYMLNKATGKDYGTTVVNFSLYDGGDISKITFADIISENGGIDVTDRSYFPGSPEQFMKGAKSYPKNSLFVDNAKLFYDLQEEYNVNAFFIATIAIKESTAGTNGSVALNKNNIFSIRYDSGEYKTYNNKQEAIKDCYRLIKERYIIGYGRKTIGKIGEEYCDPPEEWIAFIEKYMVKMMKAANIDITLISDTGLSEAKRGEAKIYTILYKGIKFYTPIDLIENKVYVSSYCGKPRQRNDGSWRRHAGIDIRTGEVGKKVYAAANGTVTRVGWENASNRKQGYGYRIYISHGNGVQTVYAHGIGGSSRVKVGDYVSAGQEIMLSGDTGSSTGPHLHFEIKLSNVPQYDTTNKLFNYKTSIDS